MDSKKSRLCIIEDPFRPPQKISYQAGGPLRLENRNTLFEVSQEVRNEKLIYPKVLKTRGQVDERKKDQRVKKTEDKRTRGGEDDRGYLKHSLETEDNVWRS
jgi:hypothetical protein